MRTGRLPRSGLCNSLTRQEKGVFAKYLSPKDQPYEDCWFYGYDGKKLTKRTGFVSFNEFKTAFTPLRQTLVLLLNEIMKDLKKEKQ